MNPTDFFLIAENLINLNQNKELNEIFYRTAINRFYFGIFHLLQKKLNIIIPDNELKRCHSFVKKNIEESKIRSDYTDLEVYRVDVDYNLLLPIKFEHYKDAKMLKNRILKKVNVPDFVLYDDGEDEYYFHKYKH